MLNTFQPATFEAVGGTVAAAMRELVEKHFHYRGGRDKAGMLGPGGLVANSGRVLGVTYVAIRVHLARLPMNLIGGRAEKTLGRVSKTRRAAAEAHDP